MSNNTGTITINTDFDAFLKKTGDEWGGYGIAGGVKPHTIEELIPTTAAAMESIKCVTAWER